MVFQGRVDTPAETGADTPDKWSCESETKGVRVEVMYNDEWIEIPTTSVEGHEARGNPIDIKRSARVEYPDVWDGTSVKQYVTANVGNEIRLARVFFDDPTLGWELTHLGFIGGLGSVNDHVSKFWVYDPWLLAKEIFVSLNFNNPSLVEAAKRIGTELDSALGGIDVEDVIVVNADYGFAETGLAASLATPTTPLDGYNFPISRAEYNPDSPANFTISSTSFSANKHTFKDVFKWLREAADAKVHFEPHYENQVVEVEGRGIGTHSVTRSVPTGTFDLVVDHQPTRKHFAQTEAFRRGTIDDPVYGVLAVIRNDALEKVGSVPNTVSVRGETSEEANINAASDVNMGPLSPYGFEGGGGAAQPLPDGFPFAKVRHSGLYQAMGKTQVGPQSIHVNASTMDEAERVARTKLRDKIAASSSAEGEIVTYGNTQVKPYDRVSAYETCPDRVEINQYPVDYEIAEVVHQKTADDVYKTHLRVAVWSDPDDIHTVARRMLST